MGQFGRQVDIECSLILENIQNVAIALFVMRWHPSKSGLSKSARKQAKQGEVENRRFDGHLPVNSFSDQPRAWKNAIQGSDKK
jgi:hypothetical protein